MFHQISLTVKNSHVLSFNEIHDFHSIFAKQFDEAFFISKTHLVCYQKRKKKLSSAEKQLIFPSKHTTKYPEFSQKWKNFFFVLPKQREKNF